MIRIGLTGGIGSGKSVVASIFHKLGVPVYHADSEAKKILSLPVVIDSIAGSFTDEVLTPDFQVNRKVLASIVFNNPSALATLNGIIHPLVRDDFEQWSLFHNEKPWVVMEAAILFESAFNSLMNKTIVVYAPMEICISRVMARDNVTRADVLARMNNQWDPEKTKKQADFIISNDNLQPVLPQILELKDLLDKISLEA